MAEELSRPPQICIVGAGMMGRWHAHAAERVGAHVVAVVDVGEAAARTLAARHDDARVFRSLGDALGAGGLDVVHVCTPVESHGQLVELALGHGCHALVEKPLGGSLAETEHVLGRARDLRLLVNPVHQFSFQPGVLALLGRPERLGELVRVTYRTCSAGGAGRSPDERRRILFEILPHAASLLHRIFGGRLGDSELGVARFSSDDLDLVGRVEETLIEVSISLRGRPTRNELELLGTRATGFADLYHGYAIVERGAVSRPAKVVRPFRLGGQLLAGAGVNLAARALRREPAYPGLRELVRRFYAAAIDGAEPPIDDAEILFAARLADRVRNGG
jgi:predicted dehydrogenase